MQAQSLARYLRKSGSPHQYWYDDPIHFLQVCNTLILKYCTSIYNPKADSLPRFCIQAGIHGNSVHIQCSNRIIHDNLYMIFFPGIKQIRHSSPILFIYGHGRFGCFSKITRSFRHSNVKEQNSSSASCARTPTGNPRILSSNIAVSSLKSFITIQYLHSYEPKCLAGQ